MRNLALLGVSSQRFPLADESLITATALDLDENAKYVAAECIKLDGGVEIDVWKTVNVGMDQVRPALNGVV